MFTASEPAGRELHDAGRRDCHLRREQMVAPAPAARPEDVVARKPPATPDHPDPNHNGDDYGADEQPHQQRIRVGRHLGKAEDAYSHSAGRLLSSLTGGLSLFRSPGTPA